jgi:hypothetical protein
MGRGGELQFRCDRLGAQTAGKEFFGEAAPQLPHPTTWRAAKVFFENSLQVAL